MKIAIIGTGGVGGYFGARMAVSGNDVTFLARGTHLDALKNNGLTVKSIRGDIILPEVKATDSIEDIDTPDLILVCLKAWQVKDVAPALAAIASEHTVIIPLQNGVSAVEELRASISGSEVWGGLCRIFSRIERPGVINHFGADPEIIFGRTDNAVTDRVREIKMLFDHCDIKSHIAGDIAAETWKKFIGICISGLMAVMRSSYGQMREIPQVRQMMRELCREVYTVACAEGVIIDPHFLDALDAVIDTYPFDSTSSLARDVWEGRHSEIEYQNGTVVKLAQKHNIKVPVNEFVYLSILPMEMRAGR